VLLGSRSSLDHDGHMGDFSSLGPGATLGGTVSVGECTAIGLGANVIHRVVIGDHTVVGAGALVLGDVPDHVTAYGLPAAVVGARHEGAAYLVRRERT
jgi:acetyltransferase-like isoleucine patch superfamily enzyme